MESKSEWNRAYIGKRSEIIGMLKGQPKKVLDVGCATGANGAAIKELCSSEVIGLEYNESMAKQAATIYDDVKLINLNSELPSKVLGDITDFDAIICGDILEHLVDPWSTLLDLKKMINPNGYIISSIPNLNHYSVIFNL